MWNRARTPIQCDNDSTIYAARKIIVLARSLIIVWWSEQTDRLTTHYVTSNRKWAAVWLIAFQLSQLATRWVFFHSSRRNNCLLTFASKDQVICLLLCFWSLREFWPRMMWAWAMRWSHNRYRLADRARSLDPRDCSNNGRVLTCF